MSNRCRRSSADQAFRLYDHGDMIIDDESPWFFGRDCAHKMVSIESELGVYTVIMFIVRFQEDSAEVKDCYYNVTPR